jgi:hypothetical protein
MDRLFRRGWSGCQYASAIKTEQAVREKRHPGKIVRTTLAVRLFSDLNSSAFQKHRQKPSSARPTQLNANTEEATATTDAKVAKVLTNGITEPRFRPRLNSVERLLPNQDGNSPRLILNPTVAVLPQHRAWSPAKIHIRAT